MHNVCIKSYVPREPLWNRVIVGLRNIGYDKYTTLPGLELATCFVTNARRFNWATVTDRNLDLVCFFVCVFI